MRNYDDDPMILFETEISSKLTDALNPADIAALDARVNIMMEKIDNLRKIDQKIIDLVFLQGISMREAATILGLTYATIRVRLMRARMSLGKFQEEKK